MRIATLAVLVLATVGCASSPAPSASGPSQPPASPGCGTVVSTPVAVATRDCAAASHTPIPTLPISPPIATSRPLPTASILPQASTGCGAAGSPAPPPDASPGCLPAARELPGAGSRLEPGRYTEGSFDPGITFAVGDDWTAVQSVAGFFDIQDAPGSLDVVAVQFANVVGVSSADEAAGEMAERVDLDVSIAEGVVIDGFAGHRVTVQTLDPADSEPPIFRNVLTARPGPLAIASGRRLEVTLLDVSGGVLAILVGGSIDEWDHAIEISRPVLESITIE